MTVIDGATTTTPTFEVGQRVIYMNDVSPASLRNMGPLFTADGRMVSDFTQGEVTYVRGGQVRVKFDDGTETRLVAGWRFAPVEIPSEQPLAEWERELLEAGIARVETAEESAPEHEAPTVETAPVPELAVGMRVSINPSAGGGENRQGPAWEDEDPFPSVGVIVGMDDDEDEDPEVRPEGYPEYDTQFVNREFLTPIIDETTTAADGPAEAPTVELAPGMRVRVPAIDAEGEIVSLDCCGSGELYVRVDTPKGYASGHYGRGQVVPIVGDETASTTIERELQVGDEVEILPGAYTDENDNDPAWSSEQTKPARGLVNTVRSDRYGRYYIRPTDVISVSQFVKGEFLKLVTSPTPEPEKADEPWKPKVNEVVLVDEDAFRKAYRGLDVPKYAQVIRLYSTSADLLYLEMAAGQGRATGRYTTSLSVLRTVPEGADAPKPIVPNKTIMRSKDNPEQLVRVTELFVDGWVNYTHLVSPRGTYDIKLDRLEPVPPIPMEPGQLKADDIKPGREYRLHPDARSCQPGGNRAFRGLKKMPERVLASENWYESTDHERGLVVHELRVGESSWVETKWLVPLDYDDESALGGDELFGRKGEVFVYDPAPGAKRLFGYYSSDKQPTRVVMEEDYRNPSNCGKWFVSALDGTPGYMAAVPPESLKELTERSPEHAYELRRLEDKVTQAKREVAKAKETFEDLLTEMFAIMDVRATDNGLCSVWEKERDGAIAKFFEEKGFKPGVMPRTTGGDVFQRKGVSYELLFVTDPAGASLRSRQLIDRKGKEYPLSKFAKEARQGLWVRIIDDGQITKD